jgi:hypothetical protein
MNNELEELETLKREHLTQSINKETLFMRFGASLAKGNLEICKWIYSLDILNDMGNSINTCFVLFKFLCTIGNFEICEWFYDTFIMDFSKFSKSKKIKILVDASGALPENEITIQFLFFRFEFSENESNDIIKKLSEEKGKFFLESIHSLGSYTKPAQM